MTDQAVEQACHARQALEGLGKARTGSRTSAPKRSTSATNAGTEKSDDSFLTFNPIFPQPARTNKPAPNDPVKGGRLALVLR